MHIFVLWVGQLCLSLHQDKHENDFLTNAIPKELLLCKHVFLLGSSSSKEQLDQLIDAPSKESWTFAKASKFKICFRFVVSMLPESDLYIVKNVTSQSLEWLNKDVDWDSAYIIAMVKQWIKQLSDDDRLVIFHVLL